MTSVCDLCGNTGFVAVPHPSCVVLGQWEAHHGNHRGDDVFYTAAVTCTCARGRKCQEKADEKNGLHKPKQMSLQKYREVILPDPEVVMRDVEKKQRKRFKTYDESNVYGQNDVRKSLEKLWEIPL